MEKLIATREKELLRKDKNVLRAAAIVALVMVVVIAGTLWSVL